METRLTISQLAKMSGLSVETIRFYQRKGLVDIPESKGQIRNYCDGHLERLQFIRRSKLLGFTLEEVKQLIALDELKSCNRVMEIARGKLNEIQKQLSRLRQTEAALVELLDQCRQNELGSGCPIVRALSEKPSESRSGSFV